MQCALWSGHDGILMSQNAVECLRHIFEYRRLKTSRRQSQFKYARLHLRLVVFDLAAETKRNNLMTETEPKQRNTVCNNIFHYGTYFPLQSIDPRLHLLVVILLDQIILPRPGQNHGMLVIRNYTKQLFI